MRFLLEGNRRHQTVVFASASVYPWVRGSIVLCRWDWRNACSRSDDDDDDDEVAFDPSLFPVDGLFFEGVDLDALSNKLLLLGEPIPVEMAASITANGSTLSLSAARQVIGYTVAETPTDVPTTTAPND